MRARPNTSRRKTLAVPALAIAIASAPLVLALSCSVGDLDLTGKECPCTTGYFCDLPSNTCVLGLPTPEAGAFEDRAIPDDALVAPERNPAALLNVTSLTPEWTTPNVVRWNFDVEGNATDFKSYVVEVGASPAAFEMNKVEIYGALDRPELSLFDARGKKAIGPAPIFTLTRATANTKPYARVTVFDKAGQANVTAITPAIVPIAATKRAKIFDGTTAATNPRPPGEFDFKNGAHVLVVDCGLAPSPCAKKVELGALDIVLNAQDNFSQADFDRAFLDIDLQGNVGGSSFDSQVAIEPGNGSCSGADCRWSFTGWTQSTAPDPGTTTLQVPLRKLVNSVRGPLTRAIVEEKGFKVAVLAFSGTWKTGATLRLLSAHVRW
jgi:hypothetical protein